MLQSLPVSLMLCHFPKQFPISGGFYIYISPMYIGEGGVNWNNLGMTLSSLMCPAVGQRAISAP